MAMTNKTEKMNRLISSIVSSFHYDEKQSEFDNHCNLLAVTTHYINQVYIKGKDCTNSVIDNILAFSHDVTEMSDPSKEEFVNFYEVLKSMIDVNDLQGSINLIVKMNRAVSDEALLTLLVESDKACLMPNT